MLQDVKLADKPVFLYNRGQMMKRSFLNLITVDGRMCRIAEFGFFADSPSFDGESIIFRVESKYKHFSLETGMVSDTVQLEFTKNHTSPNGKYTLRLEFASEVIDSIGYVHLILRDNETAHETVLTRFMGCADSIGEHPFSEDSERIVFFGYPAEEFG